MKKSTLGIFLSVLLLSVVVAYDGTASAQLKSTKDLDSDKDGIPDYLDNCPTTYNPRQTDTDGDGIGDACDPTPKGERTAPTDSDGDGRRWLWHFGALALFSRCQSWIIKPR